MCQRRRTSRRKRASSPLRELSEAAKSTYKLGSLACRLPCPAPVRWICLPLASRKEPCHEVDGGDGHANPEENTSEHSLRAAFAEGEGKAGDHDCYQREATRNGACERLLQDADRVLPRGGTLGEGRCRKQQAQYGGDQLPVCFSESESLAPNSSHFGYLLCTLLRSSVSLVEFSPELLPPGNTLP